MFTSIGAAAFIDCSSLTSVTFQGVAPTVGSEAFTNTPDGSAALVAIEALNSFGGFGTSWNGLLVSMSASYLNGLSTQVATARGYYTSSKIVDVRAGSVGIVRDGNSVTLQLQIQRNEDLESWTFKQDDLISVPLDMPANKQFFRFAMPPE